MLSWSVFFLIIAAVAAFLGFSGIVGPPAGMAKILFGYSWDGELSKTS